MNEKSTVSAKVKEVETGVLDDLINRVQDIDNSYRAVAEKVGQFYMLAEEHKLARLTGQLEKPMRNASENEQAFAALLDDLRMQRNQRK